MKLLDNDILSLHLKGEPTTRSRVAAISSGQLFVPIVAIEETLRGWLNLIRLADAGKAKVPIETAYARLRQAVSDLSAYRILNYTPTAHEHYLRLKSQKLRIGTRDLRIASIALVHDATLITRNRRDFDIVPSLKHEVWN